MRVRPAWAALLAALTAATVAADEIPGFSVKFSPSYPGYARGMTAGPDGNLWLTDAGRNEIGRVSNLDALNPDYTVGTYTSFPLPTANAFPEPITVGPDGNLWFVEKNSGKIGRCTPQGVITEFPLPGPSGSTWAIAAGSDGSLWLSNSRFDAAHVARILKVATEGTATPFPLAAGIGVGGVTAGADGNVWFIESNATMGGIGRITPEGVITDFWLAAGHFPASLTLGPDGNIWFTESSANSIGRITPAGVVTEFVIPAAGTWPTAIATGIDGNIWFSGWDSKQIHQLVLSTVTDQGQATFNDSGSSKFYQVTQLVQMPLPSVTLPVAITTRGAAQAALAGAGSSHCPGPTFIVRDSSSGAHNARACGAAAPDDCADVWVPPSAGFIYWIFRGGESRKVIRKFVENSGPDAAENVVIRLEFTASGLAFDGPPETVVYVQNADSTSFPCVVAGLSIECHIPQLPRNGRAIITAIAKEPVLTDRVIVAAFAFSDTPDPVPTNNSVALLVRFQAHNDPVLPEYAPGLVAIPVRGTPH